MIRSIKIFFWVLFVLVFLEVALDLVNASNTMCNIGGLCLLMLIACVSYQTKCFTDFKINLKKKKKNKKNMKKLLSLVAVATLLTSCVPERIDAGCEGIIVKLYGDDKGVGEVSMCTGAVWYNPFTESVFEYPTYVQTIDYQPFTTNSKEGSEFTLDPNVLLKIEDGKSPQIFKKYRKSMGELMETVIYKYVKDACRIQLNKYDTDYIVSHREEVENAIETYLRSNLSQEHFMLESMTTGLQYPQAIVEAVNAKTKAIQLAQQAENEVKVAEANAKKLMVAAEAEAEANKLKTQALTPAILEKMWIEKWDGKLPVYGQVPTIFKDISK